MGVIKPQIIKDIEQARADEKRRQFNRNFYMKLRYEAMEVMMSSEPKIKTTEESK